MTGLLALVSGVASGQELRLELSRAGAGGGYSAAGELALVSTIGQAEAGARMTSETQALETGFWHAAGLDNAAPTLAVIPNPVAILEDAAQQTVTLGAISAGPVDEGWQALTVTVTSSNPGLIPNPVVTYTSPDATGTLTYTPVANASGTALITVVVRDDGGTANGGVSAVTNTFTVTVVAVNDAPTAVADSYTVNQGDTLNAIISAGVLVNDTDVENDTLTATKLDGPSHGLAALNPNGSFTYTPAAGFHGLDSFTYRAADHSSNSKPATVSILVYARPTNAVPGAQTVFSSSALRFSATNTVNNSVRVGDPDSSALMVTLNVTNGTLGVTVTNGLTLPNGATNTNTLVMVGPIINLNAALESLAYVSNTNYFGDDTLSLLAQDEGGRTNRGSGSVSILVEIPARGASLEVPLQGFNNPNIGLRVTNVTAVSLDTNLVQGISFDPTNNVITVLPVGGQDGFTNRSTVTVAVRFNDGSTQMVTVPVIIYQPLLTATTNSGSYDSTFSTPLFNPQTSLYEQKVQVQNNTPFDFTALRITATNMPATVTLQNATLTNGGLPCIEHNLTVPSGRSVTLKLEYFSSDLAPFTPGLKLELLNTTRTNSAPPGAVMTSVAPKTGYAPDGLVKNYLYFPSRTGQRYYVQYKDDVAADWKTSGVVILGTGLEIHWMDDGPPSTESSPSRDPGKMRLYRVITDR